MIFIPTGNTGIKPLWLKDTDDPDKDVLVMGRSELKSCAENTLVSIGSHTRSHSRLMELPIEEAHKEIEVAKGDLMEISGTDNSSFSFPHGGYNRELVDYLKKTGYKYIFTIEPGIYTEQNKTGVIGRVGVSPCDWIAEFKLKAYGAYSWLVLCKRVFGRGA